VDSSGKDRRAEARWLEGERDRVVEEAQAAQDLGPGLLDSWNTGELAIWLWRCDAMNEVPPRIAEPYARHIAGDWRGAAELWDKLGCPYDAAMARSDSSDEVALRSALDTFVKLGAEPAAALLRRKMRRLGIKAIPRGHRPATRSSPLNLTPREQEVLTLLYEGLTNAEISSRLFISEKTVDHHVSSVLSKVGVRSRIQAAREAVRLGLVAT
jgi:DNA-binding CsgD family transcriptional regulator